MKIVAQRVSASRVSVASNVIGEIGHGLCVLVGVAPDDTESDVDRIVEKLVNLRIFEDGDGKMNRSLLDTGGSILAVSQFTLFADCRKGRRPSFIGAADPTKGKALYEHFVKAAIALGVSVSTGEFGADMKLEIINEGPVTIVLDSADLTSRGIV